MLESDNEDGLDLLFVTYRAEKITVARLKEKIKTYGTYGLKAEVKK